MWCSPVATNDEDGAVDMDSIMREIDDARAEEAARVVRMQTVD